MKNSSGRPSRPFYGWYLVAAAWLMAFLVPATAVGIFFKPLLDEFGWSRAGLSLVSSVSLLVFAVLSPFIGRLIDRFGARRVLFFTTLAQISSSLVYGLARQMPAVYLGRLLYELKPTHGTQVLINRWFVRRRGQALGLLSSGIPLGQLLLSPLSQYLITAWGWRQTCFFWAGATALLVLPLFLLIRDDPREMGCRPDGDSAPETPPAAAVSNTAVLDTIGGKGGIVAALRQRSFRLLAATHIICGISCGFMATHIVILAVDLGYSSLVGASFLSVQGGISLAGVLVTGYLSDRLSRAGVLSLTHFIRSLGLWTLVLPLLAGINSPFWLYAGNVLFGFGWFTTAPLASGLAADLFGHRRLGTLLGLILSTHMIGMAAGAFAGGLVFQWSGHYQPMLAAAAALELLAAFCAANIRRSAAPAISR